MSGTTDVRHAGHEQVAEGRERRGKALDDEGRAEVQGLDEGLARGVEGVWGVSMSISVSMSMSTSSG